MKIVPRPLTGVATTSVDQHAGQMGRGGSCHVPQSRAAHDAQLVVEAPPEHGLVVVVE